MDGRPEVDSLPTATDAGGHDVESLLVLRLPERESRELLARLQREEERARNASAPSVGGKRAAAHADALGEHLAVRFDAAGDGRRAVVRLTDDNGRSEALHARLLDLPCIVEVTKTLDKKNFYKVADACQLLQCTREPPAEPPAERSAKHPERAVQLAHGLTPPMKNVRRRRFRRTLKKKFMEAEELEKELKRLLRADMAADSVRWELAAAAPEATPSTSDTAAGAAGGAAPTDGGGGPAALSAPAPPPPPPPVDEADVFGGAVSSSSSDEDGGGGDAAKGKKKRDE